MTRIVKLYEGTHVDGIGTPQILVAASRSERDFIADGFLLFRNQPNLSDVSAKYLRFRLPMFDPYSDDSGLQNSEERVVNLTKRHLEGRLFGLQLVEYQRSKNDRALNRCAFTACEPIERKN